MNRRCSAPIVLLFSLTFGSFLWAQSGGASIPEVIKTAVNLTAEQQAAVQAFVNAKVAELSDEKNSPADARNALVAEALLRGSPNASPAYLETYAGAINSALLPLFKSPHMPQRLNAAIVAAKVADRSGSIRLMDTLVAALADKTEPVALWGVKGARTILPAVLRNPLLINKNALLPGIVAAVRNHPAGAVAFEAYEALGLNVIDPEQRKMVTPPMLTATIPAMQAVLERRIAEYKTTLPSEPAAENRATLLLTYDIVWRTQTREQQTASVQALSDLLALAVQWLAKAPAGERSALLSVVMQTSKALYVVAQPGENETLIHALTPLTKLQSNITGAQLAQLYAPVFPALHAVFGELRQPPLLEAAATEPAQ